MLLFSVCKLWVRQNTWCHVRALPSQSQNTRLGLRSRCAVAAQEWNLQVVVLTGTDYPLAVGMGGQTIYRNGLRLTRNGNTGDVLAQGDLMSIEQAVLRHIKETQAQEERARLLAEYRAGIAADRAEGLRKQQMSQNAGVHELIDALQKQIDELRAERSVMPFPKGSTVSPRRYPDELSDKIIGVAVTATERADLRVRANELGVTVSELVRQALFATKVVS